MRGQLRTLAQSTFAGFFESELVKPGLSQVRLVILAIAVLMLPALQIPLRAALAYDAARLRMPDGIDLLMWPHKVLFITLSMVGTAMVALVIWDNVFPDRREAFIIGHLPLEVRTLVGGRLLALAGLMGLVAVGSAAPSALLYGIVAGAYSPGGMLRSVIAHFVATVGASTFAFVLLLTLQGVLINVIPGRWLQRAMVVLQFVFVVAALETLLFMHPILGGLEKAMARGVASGWMEWAPPAWFLGVYEAIAGTERPVFGLALSAAASLGILGPAAFGLYAFTYQRLTRRAVEAKDAQTIGGGIGREPLLGRLAARLTRGAIANAVCRFTLLTLLRSRKHRLLFTIFASVGTTAAAMSVLAPLSRGRLDSVTAPQAVLPVGLVLIFFLVVGLRTLMGIPAEPAANWAFRLSDAEDARWHVRGAAAALVGGGVIPVIAILAPVHVLTLGVAAAAVHSGLMLAAGLLLAEVVLYRFRRVPFTCSYAAPPQTSGWMWPFWLIGFLNFSFTLASLERVALARPVAAAMLIAAIGAAALAVRLVRELDFHPSARMLTFDDAEDDAPVTLELGGIVAAPAPHRPG